MRWSDILISALGNLRRRKLRSLLTILGVAIGTAMIIVTVSLGNGAEQAQLSVLESNTNLQLINVMPYYSYVDNMDMGETRRVTRIGDAVIRDIRRMNGVKAVTPVVSAYVGTNKLQSGKYQCYTSLIAVSPVDFARIWKLESGRYFSGNTSRMEFIMTKMSMMEFRDPSEDYEYVDTYSLLYNGQELPLPDINWLKDRFTFTIQWEDYEHTDSEGNPAVTSKEYDARMVGVLETNLNDWTFAYGTVVSLDFLKRVYKENKALFQEMGFNGVDNYETVYVLADSVDAVDQLSKDLHDYGLQTYSSLDTVNMVREQVASMQAFLGFIGAVSMLVAALSIANTMMMSIYERTREIGVMKVLGCRLSNIRALFLAEAGYIGAIGGLVGVGVSYLVSYALNHVTWMQNMIADVMQSSAIFATGGESTSVITPPLAWGTLGFVTAVSVLFGLYPAIRAMRLSSLAAIRNAE